MGLVFPWAAIREGRVPSETDFVSVRSEIMGLLRENMGLVKAAAIIGSLVRGDMNPRSDVDLIVVYRSLSGEDRRPGLLNAKLAAVARAHNTILHLHEMDANQARRGAVGMGPSYRNTFARLSAGEYTLGPIDKCFGYTEGLTVREEMIEKMQNKLRSTETRAGQFRTLSRDVPRLDPWMQTQYDNVSRPLRVYVTIARRAMWWLCGDLKDDGKHAVVQAFLAESQFERFHAEMRVLRIYDDEYGRLLEGTQRGSVDRREYLMGVRDLHRANFEVSVRVLRRLVAHMGNVPLTPERELQVA